MSTGFDVEGLGVPEVASLRALRFVATVCHCVVVGLSAGESGAEDVALAVPLVKDTGLMRGRDVLRARRAWLDVVAAVRLGSFSERSTGVRL